MKSKALVSIFFIFALIGAAVAVYLFVVRKEKEAASAPKGTVEIEDLQLNEFGDYIVLPDGTAISKT